MSAEPRPATAPSLTALPAYLGFGRLMESSVRACQGTVSAVYQWEGETACVVGWRRGDCRLDSYSDGKLFASSYGRDLQEAFYQRFSALVQASHKDPQLLALWRRVMRVVLSAHFTFPGRPSCRFLFYPAGLIFRLRQVVTETNRPAYAEFKQSLAERGEDCPLWLDEEGPGAITRFLTDGSHSEETVHVVDWEAKLVDLVDAVRLLGQSGLTLPGKAYRLAIGTPGSLSLYQGEPERGYTAFSIARLGEREHEQQEV